MNMPASVILLLTLIPLSCHPPATVDLPGPDVTTHDSFFESMESNTQWPSYRGYFASGYMHDTDLPDSFHVESGYNVRWNIEIPGLGLSCPVIWDDRVFITTAISKADDQGYQPGIYGDIEPVEDSSEHTWKLFCFDKNSGDLIWEEILHEGIPAVKRHPKSSHATTSVATDGEHVVVFLGSEGLYCYTIQGNRLWKRDFGLIRSAWDVVESAEWEFSSSPVIFRDRLILQADALNQAFVAVLHLETGETIWRREREEIPNWCTPNVYFDGDRPRVVVNGYKHRGAYDLETGEEIWKMSGGGDVPIPTPVVWKDLIFFNSAHGRYAPLMAVKNSATGIIPYPKRESGITEHLAWFKERNAAYMNSVVVYDSLLYRFRWNGNLSVFDARSGEEVYSETVHPTSFIASPVISDGRLYLVAEEGTVYIVKAGRKYELLHRIPLGEVSLVAPGLVKDVIIFRTASRLIAVAKS